MNESGRNIAVGLFVLLGMVVLGGLILSFQTTVNYFGGMRDYYIEITSPSSADVRSGQNIRLNGKPIGTISSVELAEDPRQGVIITAAIDQKYTIPADVEVVHIYQGQIGPPYIEIKALPSHSARMMDKTPGRVVARLRAETPSGPFSELASMAQELKPALQEVGPTLAKISTLADNLNAMVRDEKTRENFKESLANLRQAGQDASEALQELKGFAGQAKQTTSQLELQLRDVAQGIIRNSEQISELLRKLNQATEQINQGQGTAGKILYDPALYEEMLTASKQLNESLTTLRTMLKTWNKEGVKLKW